MSRSCFNSPIFLVPKPHGHGMRAVLDFREVNNASVPDRYTIREVRDCVDEIDLADSKVFSTIDLTSGFWQQSLEEESRQYTGFTRYQWTVTPMGLQGSPASFARLIDYTMQGLQGVLTYINDVLGHTFDHESQLALLEKTFLRLRKYNLKLNVSKSFFRALQVNYLGYTLSGEGIAPGKEKLQAVQDFPAPISVKQIREFVGLCNYFRFLIPGFTFHSSVLTNLTFQKSGYVGGELPPLAASAFKYLKNKLCESPLVSYPRRGFIFHLATDACAGDDNHKGGFGAVLTQILEDGEEHVIAYASRSLKPNEENYSAYLLELAAASWVIDHFSVYLRGKHFGLFTDHKPLETLSKVHKKTLNRLEQQLLEYDFKINYRQGASNSAADALSRNVALKTVHFLFTMSDESGDIIAEQKDDHFVSDVRDCFLKSKSPRGSPGYNAKAAKVASNCFLDKGVVWYNLYKHGGIAYPVVLCSDSMKHMVMDGAHCSSFAGLSGKQRTVDRIELGYWWPGLTYDVQNFLHKCPVCQELQGRKPIPSPLNSLPTVAEPNIRVHMDLFGPLKVRSANGKKYIMVMTDAFSKYTELAAICDKKADTVAKVFF